MTLYIMIEDWLHLVFTHIIVYLYLLKRENFDIYICGVGVRQCLYVKQDYIWMEWSAEAIILLGMSEHSTLYALHIFVFWYYLVELNAHENWTILYVFVEMTGAKVFNLKTNYHLSKSLCFKDSIEL